jgi:hypothetical protein
VFVIQQRQIECFAGNAGSLRLTRDDSKLASQWSLNRLYSFLKISPYWGMGRVVGLRLRINGRPSSIPARLAGNKFFLCRAGIGNLKP